MNKQKSEIGNREISAQLAAEEMDGVSGGIMNNETVLYKLFAVGIIEGFREAGGTVHITFVS